jgi:hypothetical protein
MSRLTDPIAVLKTSIKFIETTDRKDRLLTFDYQISSLIQECRNALLDIEIEMKKIREESAQRKGPLGGQ